MNLISLLCIWEVMEGQGEVWRSLTPKFKESLPKSENSDIIHPDVVLKLHDCETQNKLFWKMA